MYTIEAAHNPEVAGSNPALAIAKGVEKAPLSLFWNARRKVAPPHSAVPHRSPRGECIYATPPKISGVGAAAGGHRSHVWIPRWRVVSTASVCKHRAFVAILAGMPAAILPAGRASRLNVLEALQYESTPCAATAWP